jgi:hypothetical protein
LRFGWKRNNRRQHDRPIATIRLRAKTKSAQRRTIAIRLRAKTKSAQRGVLLVRVDGALRPGLRNKAELAVLLGQLEIKLDVHVADQLSGQARSIVDLILVNGLRWLL